ncbi:MAG: hypothetical protein R2724_35070 [Bryobacterales bacterium]
MAESRYTRDTVRAVIGGVVALAVASGLGVTLSVAGTFEMQRLLEALRGVLPYFASAAMSASATVLALMLTVLGIGHRSEHTLSPRFYRRVQWIGRQATGTLAAASVLLLTMAVPVAEIEDKASSAATLIRMQYYATCGLTGLVSGVLVSMVLMLESTLTGLVCVLGLRQTDHWLLVQETPPDEAE